MKNLLFIAGGVLVGVGVYAMLKPSKKKCGCGGKCGGDKPTVIAVTNQEAPMMTAQDNADYWLQQSTVRYDSNPVSTFAPAKTQVIMPQQMVDGVMNFNMARELVDQ
jgi:hypothetical protein